MDEIIAQMRGRLDELTRENKALIAAADADARDLSDEESKQVDANLEEFKAIQADIKRRERVIAMNTELEASNGRITEPAGGDDPKPNGGTRAGSRFNPSNGRAPGIGRQIDQRTHGFKSYGEFLNYVVIAANNPSAVDARLQISAAGGMMEQTGQDGGFLVPPDWRTTIAEKALAEDSLIGRTDGIPTGSNTLVIPKDEITQWDETRGIQAFWEGEAREITPTRGAPEQAQLRLNKLTSLVYVSDELLEDAAALEGYIRRKAPEKIDYKVNMALIHGTGAGMPKGILNSAFTVEAASSTSATDIVLYEDIVAMWARLYGPWRAGAIWLIHPEVEEKLNQMAFDSTAPSPVPVYLPANGLSATPYGTLMGRPVMPMQVCAQPSDPGDIILSNWSQYLSSVKGGGVRTDVSIHVAFNTDETAFRFIMRIGGQPWFDRSIEPRVGTMHQSAFVTLADRT